MSTNLIQSKLNVYFYKFVEESLKQILNTFISNYKRKMKLYKVKIIIFYKCDGRGQAPKSCYLGVFEAI